MLLAGREQTDELSHSNFGAVKLLGSSGRIKPLCLKEQKGKIPNTSSAPSSSCFGQLLLPVVLISATKWIIPFGSFYCQYQVVSSVKHQTQQWC